MGKSFGEYLDQVMKSQFISSHGLYRRCDGHISYSYILHLRKGLRKQPKPYKLLILAKGLGVPYSEIMEKAGHTDPDEKRLTLKNKHVQDILDMLWDVPEDKQKEAIATVKEGLSRLINLK